MRSVLTIGVTLHREGNLSRATLTSLQRSITRSNTKVSVIMAQDRADDATLAVCNEFAKLSGLPCEQLQLDFGDPALCRNAIVAAATARWIMLIDGDDLVSENYISNHIVDAIPSHILRPEFIVSFGERTHFHSQPDERAAWVPPSLLVEVNPWASPLMAERAMLLDIPFLPVMQHGFGFEDWLWNADVKARSIRNIVARGTTYFYRRKPARSRNEGAIGARTVLPSSRLFDP